MCPFARLADNGPSAALGQQPRQTGHLGLIKRDEQWHRRSTLLQKRETHMPCVSLCCERYGIAWAGIRLKACPSLIQGADVVLHGLDTLAAGASEEHDLQLSSAVAVHREYVVIGRAQRAVEGAERVERAGLDGDPLLA